MRHGRPDVTDLEAVRAAVARARDELGRPVDVLVHNAGIAADFGQGAFRTLDPARWRAPVEINLFGAMNCVSAVVDDMCESGWGRIVQISSGAARTGSDQGLSLYGTAKSGVEGFIRHLSQELAPLGGHGQHARLGAAEQRRGCCDGGVHREGRIQLVVATPWLRGGAMAVGLRQKQVREYRGQLPSPGRPTVAWREDRVRFWASIATGVMTDEASEAAGVSVPVGYR